MATPRNDTFAAPRRELATRNARWAAALAKTLGRAGIRPNGVSIAGVVFAVVAGLALALTPNVDGTSRVALLLLAAACIQLRLLCNLLDGMLAVEEGFKSRTGDLFNDLPDRLADVVILVGAGYAVRDVSYGEALGWAAAVLAVFTAYIRVLAGSLKQRQHFIGPMAKQHRMFTLTLATVLASVEVVAALPPRAILVGLIAIVAGSVMTAVRRTARLARELNAAGLQGCWPQPVVSSRGRWRTGGASRTPIRSASISAITRATSTSSSSGRRCHRNCGTRRGRWRDATTGTAGSFAATWQPACSRPC